MCNYNNIKDINNNFNGNNLKKLIGIIIIYYQEIIIFNYINIY